MLFETLLWQFCHLLLKSKPETELTLLINYAGKWTPPPVEWSGDSGYLYDQHKEYFQKIYCWCFYQICSFFIIHLVLCAMSEKHDITVIIETNT